MDEYKKEKDILAGIEDAEAVHAAGEDRKCDWNDPQDISIMRADERRLERKLNLDRIVPKRICPACRNRIFGDSSWVIEGDKAWCRSCYQSRGQIDDGKKECSLFQGIVVRVKIDGWKIKIMRKSMGVGQQAFAARMGWSANYQNQVEGSKVRTVTLEVAERLVGVFEDIGIRITDTI